MMTRKEAREFMMQVFFQMDAGGSFDVDDKAKYFSGFTDKGQEKYCSEMFSVMCNKKDEIDRLITENMRGWTLSRMPKTDLAVLRVAVCEMATLRC